MDRTFGKHNEDHNSNLEITPSTTRVLYSKVSASTLSDEVTPSPAAPEVYEIFDISYSHIDDPEEEI